MTEKEIWRPPLQKVLKWLGGCPIAKVLSWSCRLSLKGKKTAEPDTRACRPPPESVLTAVYLTTAERPVGEQHSVLPTRSDSLSGSSPVLGHGPDGIESEEECYISLKQYRISLMVLIEKNELQKKTIKMFLLIILIKFLPSRR